MKFRGIWRYVWCEIGYGGDGEGGEEGVKDVFLLVVVVFY